MGRRRRLFADGVLADSVYHQSDTGSRAAPGLLLVAAIGLWEFWGWLARGQWVAGALYAAGCAASVFFVALPVSDGAGLWSLDYYNTGIKATENGDLGSAPREPGDRFRIRAGKFGNQFRPRQSLAGKGEPRPLRKLLYTAAIRMNSRHSGAFNNLGTLAIEDQQWAAAEDYLQKAIAIDPDDAKTYYLLAKARFGAGALAGRVRLLNMR